MLVHLAVTYGNCSLRHQLRNLIGNLLYSSHPVKDHINLTAPSQLPFDDFLKQLVVLFQHIGLYRVSFLRRLFNEAHILDACKRHVESTRNRRSRQCQHIHACFKLFDGLLGLHAEALLLVNHQKAQVLKLHIGGQKPVCADYKIHLTFLKARNYIRLLSRSLESAENLHLEREVFKSFLQCIIVLVCQNGSRNQHRRLFSVCHTLEQGAGCNLRLAEAHITAEKPIH